MQRLKRKTKVHDIAADEYGDLTLEPHGAAGLAFRQGAGIDEVVEGDHLRANDSALEVRMDLPGRFRSRGPLGNRPRPRLLRPCGEIGLQAERVESDASELVEPGFFQPRRL